MGVMKIAVRGEDWRNGYGKEKKKDERFFEELGKYIGETATIVGNKAGEVIETQKLKSQVRSLTHENTVDLLELGRGVYEQYKSGAVLDEKAEGLCEAISSREESIAEFEEKISAIRGAGKCPNCGKTVAKEMVFCPYCGEKMPAVAVDDEDVLQIMKSLREKRQRKLWQQQRQKRVRRQKRSILQMRLKI